MPRSLATTAEIATGDARWPVDDVLAWQVIGQGTTNRMLPGVGSCRHDRALHNRPRCRALFDILERQLQLVDGGIELLRRRPELHPTQLRQLRLQLRTLAQRSSEAAKDIAALILNSSSQVATGVKLVKEAGSALSEIVTSSTYVSSSLDEIKSASQEQASGIEEVAKVVAHMDEMIQRNSAMADQSASLATDLQQATESLQGLVEEFRLAPGHAPGGQVNSNVTELRGAGAKMAARAAPAAKARVLRPTSKSANGGWEEF